MQSSNLQYSIVSSIEYQRFRPQSHLPLTEGIALLRALGSDVTDEPEMFGRSVAFGLIDYECAPASRHALLDDRFAPMLSSKSG
jgi:hypothetical protein